MPGETLRAAKLTLRTILLIAALGTTVPASADEPGSLAEAFYQEGDYFRAITEFRRSIHETADEAETRRLWLRIADAYLAAKRYTEALNVLHTVSTGIHTPVDAARICFRTGRVYLEAGVLAQARSQFTLCLGDAGQAAFLGNDRLRLAIAATHFEDGDWSAAAADLEFFEQDFPTSFFRGDAALLRRAALDADERPQRSLALAGALSAVIPGAGQAYIGRYWDALRAFAIVGILGAATGALFYYDLHQSHPTYVLPVMMGTATGVFYISGIYGAINGARMSNMMDKYQYIRDEKQKYQPIFQTQ